MATSSDDRPQRAARVAVIDDGFDLTHPALAGVDLLLQYDADRHVADATPAVGIDRHGTQVAGLIFADADAGHPGGLAPGAGLIAIRQVSTWTSDMVLAFSVARMMRADIVNASWTLAWLPEPVYALLSDWQRDAQPPYLVVAAGNAHGDACRLNALAAVPGAWLVGARGPDGRTLRYSNHGPCVDLHAPARFTSTLPGQAYGSFTGTSAAAAHVSAVLAREVGRGARPDLRAVQALVRAETSSEAAP
nr:S8/S53 family peptidase [Xanthomonas sp. XNM01]